MAVCYICNLKIQTGDSDLQSLKLRSPFNFEVGGVFAIYSSMIHVIIINLPFFGIDIGKTNLAEWIIILKWPRTFGCSRYFIDRCTSERRGENDVVIFMAPMAHLLVKRRLLVVWCWSIIHTWVARSRPSHSN